MKTFLYFIGTCFISNFAFWGALSAKNPFPALAIAFGIWALFLWGCDRRSRKAREQRYREKLLEEYIRMMMRDRMHWH